MNVTKRQSYSLLFAAIALLLVPGCTKGSSESQASAVPVASVSPSPPVASSTSHQAPASNEPAASEGASSNSSGATDPIRVKLSKMTLNEKIGQMVIVGIDGTSLQPAAKQMIDTYKVGGFILYKPNITSASQTINFVNQLKKENKDNLAPLWISTDQEGGRVSRMPAPYVKIPPMGNVGDVNDVTYSRHIGEALATEAKSLGFNLDFAPDMDINSNPNNPVIGDRSFGSTSDTVIRNGLAVMEGLRSEGVAEVVKHFPGHGDTSVDSHLELPVVNKSLEQLKSFELLPFQAAIQHNTDMIMVAHLLIPKIDSQYPASISKKIITDLLRDSLHYNGVIITDDMTMGGIVKHFGIDKAAVLSAKAGSDIILVGHDLDRETLVIQALRKAAIDGSLTEQEIDDKVYRILKLKEKYQLTDSPTPQVNVTNINNQVQKLLKH